MSGVLAAMHVHSSWSHDAEWSLASIARAFRRRGYGCVLLCDHDPAFDQDRFRRYAAECADESLDDLLLVPGVEYACPDNIVHIPVWGDVPFLGSGHGTTALLERVSDVGGVAVMAHPSRRKAWARFDPRWSEHLSAIEIWNRKYDGWAPARQASAIRADPRHSLKEVVSLDFHTSRQFFPLALRLDVPERPTRHAVECALREKRYTATFLRRPAGAFVGGLAGGGLARAEAARQLLRPLSHGRFWTPRNQ